MKNHIAVAGLVMLALTAGCSAGAAEVPASSATTSATSSDGPASTPTMTPSQETSSPAESSTASASPSPSIATPTAVESLNPKQGPKGVMTEDMATRILWASKGDGHFHPNSTQVAEGVGWCVDVGHICAKMRMAPDGSPAAMQKMLTADKGTSGVTVTMLPQLGENAWMMVNQADRLQAIEWVEDGQHWSLALVNGGLGEGGKLQGGEQMLAEVERLHKNWP